MATPQVNVNVDSTRFRKSLKRVFSGASTSGDPLAEGYNMQTFGDKKVDHAHSSLYGFMNRSIKTKNECKNYRGKIMVFVNEWASEEDVKKYGLEEIDKRFLVANVRYGWTVDHERDIYLRWIESGREEFSHFHKFHLFWKGALIEIELILVDGGGKRGGAGWVKWALERFYLPDTLVNQREEILHDLKEALMVFGEFGMYSTINDCVVSFEF